MTTPLMSAHSSTGDHLEVYDHKIVIKRKGIANFLVQGLKGDKEIPIKYITSIQFKDPGMITSGYMQFTLLGGQEAKGGLFEGAADENTVMFSSKEAPQFKRIKEHLEKIIFSPAPITLGSNANHHSRTPLTDSDDLIGKLERLGNLKAQGILSSTEFEEQKANLLGTSSSRVKTNVLSSIKHPTPMTPPINNSAKTIPCPLCEQPLETDTLKYGDNYCPHCNGKFIGE